MRFCLAALAHPSVGGASPYRGAGGEERTRLTKVAPPRTPREARRTGALRKKGEI